MLTLKKNPKNPLLHIIFLEFTSKDTKATISIRFNKDLILNMYATYTT